MNQSGPNKKRRGITIAAIAGGILLAAGIGWLARTATRPVPPEPTQAPTATPTVTPSPTPVPTPSPTPKPTPTPSPTPEPTPTPKVMLQSIQGLRDAHGNDDIVGYIYIPDTTIDYAITQAEDNDYYLERDIDKKYDVAGWPYMDFQNDPESDEDWNTIIYGHNMNKNYMFHGLRYFREESYYKEHKYLVYTTLYERELWEVFAFYRADASVKGTIQFYYTRVLFDEYAQFEKLVTQMKSKEMYDTGVAFEEGDRILSLSTCTNDDVNGRYVLSLVKVKDLSNVPEEILALLAAE